MGPELHTVIADFLNLLLHLSEKTLKLLDIGELLIGVMLLACLGLDIGINHCLVSEDCELLVKVWSFLLGNFELMNGRMNVFKALEVEVRENNVNRA